jgi:hypothetical protein
MPDENIINVFERLSVSSRANLDGTGKQRYTSISGNESQQRGPLKVNLGNLQNSSSTQRAPSELIRKLSVGRSNRIPSVVRKASMDRLGGTKISSANSRKASGVDHPPTLIRKGSLDGLSVNLNTKRIVSSSTSSSNNKSKAINGSNRVVDIGSYDGSLERDEKRGRRSNDVRGGLLDLDARKLAVTQQKQWSLLDFELGHPLGKGKFGRVFVARTKPSATDASKPGYIIALKALYKDEIIKEGLELQVRREIGESFSES